MIFAVGVDHAGVPLHDVATSTLIELGHEVLDLGQCDDYPDMALKMGLVIDSGEAERGILACGSGAGIAVAASKLPGIRAQTIHDTYTAHQAVEHDAVNVLCIGGRLLAREYALELIDLWLDTAFETRHQARLDKISALETARGQG